MPEWDWGIKPMLIAFNDHPYFPVLTSVDRIALEVTESKRDVLARRLNCVVELSAHQREDESTVRSERVSG